MFQLAALLSVVACALGATLPDVILPPLDGRIVGGNATTIESYPYQVSLQYLGFHICGGSILDSNYFATAAHCFPSHYSTSGYSVRVGSTSRDSGGTVLKVSEIIIHPDYDSRTNVNDIALGKVSGQITFNSRTKPISLATSKPDSGTEALVSGWGRTSSESQSSPVELRAVTVIITSQDLCQKAYRPKPITPEMFCAAGEGKDSCQGDSGGPLVVGKTLVGIVSWGYGCAKPLYPGVYTSVPSYNNWVYNEINK